MATWDWDAIKKDLEKGLKDGLALVKEGAKVVGEKAGELTVEGKRQYKVVELKTKTQKALWDLGSRVYDLMGSRAKNPATDAKVKEIVAQVRKYEGQLAALGGKTAAKPKKAAKKK